MAINKKKASHGRFLRFIRTWTAGRRGRRGSCPDAGKREEWLRVREDWYIGGVNACEPREAIVPLTMLTEGKTYQATIYRDGEQADWQTNPYDYIIETRIINSSATLRIPMAAGGGFALRLVPIE